MTRWIVAGLFVLNVMLGVGVYMHFGERAAQAQIGTGKSDIASVAGFSNGQTIIYMLDANSGRLVALRTDPINKRIEVAATKDVAADTAEDSVTELFALVLPGR